MYASPELGVFPHTVQTYGFEDHTAGAYGNDNFSAIENYLVFEAKRGERSVAYYGETAYWVNVDIDVPLFLPITPQRRLHDLRKIAFRETAEGFRMHGQMNFDSGWEYGYWLNDVVTARAAWNPFVEVGDDWEAFRRSLAPVISIFGPKYSADVASILVDLSRAQEELLINGIVDGIPSPNIRKLSGFAYLSGVDTWVDVPRVFGLPITQPDKLHLYEFHHPLWRYVSPLLVAMEERFQLIFEDIDRVYDEFVASLSSASEAAPDTCSGKDDACPTRAANEKAILQELRDCILLLALRAKQVRYTCALCGYLFPA